MRTIFFIMLTACLIFTHGASRAQSLPSISSLSIGSKVPDKLWDLIPRKSNTKLIILDFWNIWCSGCMDAFPKLDSLQKQFDKEIKIVLITKNSEAEVKKAFSTYAGLRNTKFPGLTSFTGDQIFSMAFPYELIPHHVWIDGDGIVKAFTNGETTTTNYIEKYLEGKELRWSQKIDIPGFDYEKPLFMGDQLDIRQLLHYSLLTKGRVQIGARSSWRIDEKNKTVRILQINHGLMSMYEWAIRRAWPLFERNRLLVEIKDSLGLFFDSSKMDIGTWRDSNSYCYNIVIPVSQQTHMFQYMLDDLNRYTGYYGRIEKRKVTCLALVNTSRENKIKTKGGTPAYELHEKGNFFLKNSPLDLLVTRLNYTYPLPVIYEVGHNESVDIILRSDVSNLSELRLELKKYNLDLVQAEREIELFVISEKNDK